MAEALGCAAAKRKTIEIGGNFSKRAGAGPVAPADVTISTSALTGVLAYEPRDLTISVEAGLRYSELSKLLAEHSQMIPLDPPFSNEATIAGIIASNGSGPRRRLYGTARDLVIGMKFATLEGKLVQSGGMVVKNVAGLDMAKLMIGSWGTLAAIASVNFKLIPIPAVQRTMLLGVNSPAAAAEIRDRLVRGVLQPSSVDYINPQAAAELGYKKALLALEFGGNQAVIDRCQREVANWGEPVDLTDAEAEMFWFHVQNFTASYLQKLEGATVVRISCTLSVMREVMESLEGPAIARFASGLIYAHFTAAQAAATWMSEHPQWKSVIEYGPREEKRKLELWPSPSSEMELMKRVKNMFDPHNLLNRGRYYRHF